MQPQTIIIIYPSDLQSHETILSRESVTSSFSVSTDSTAPLSCHLSSAGDRQISIQSWTVKSVRCKCCLLQYLLTLDFLTEMYTSKNIYKFPFFMQHGEIKSKSKIGTYSFIYHKNIFSFFLTSSMSFSLICEYIKLIEIIFFLSTGLNAYVFLVDNKKTPCHINLL